MSTKPGQLQSSDPCRQAASGAGRGGPHLEAVGALLKCMPSGTESCSTILALGEAPCVRLATAGGGGGGDDGVRHR